SAMLVGKRYPSWPSASRGRSPPRPQASRRVKKAMAADATAAIGVPDTARCRRHRVRIDGTAGPFLVMAHGFGTHQTAWNPVWPHFADRYRIVRFDLAGAGPNAAETFDPARYADIEAYADDLLMILDDLEIPDCAFLGASVG